MTTGDRTATVVIEGDGTPPPPEPRGSEASVLDLLKRLYQLLYSKTLGLSVILAMTVLVLLGVLIGQTTSATYADPAAKQAFLEQARGKFGGFTPILDFLGLFRVFTSPLFLIVTILLALSIAACTIHRIPLLWRNWRQPRVHVSDRFFDKARFRGSAHTDLSPDAALSAVKQHLESRKYRVLEDPQSPGRLYADRTPWGPMGTVVAHASFLVILAAFVVTASGGIEDTLVVPVGGSPVDVGHNLGLTVQANTFSAQYDDTGRPKDYVSDLVVRRGKDVVAHQETRVNSPLRYDGIKFHQSSFGIAADVVVTDSTGATIFDRSVALQWTSDDGTQVYGRFSLPDQDAQIWVATAASGADDSTLAAGEALFELYQGDSTEPVTQEVATQGTPVALAGFNATFQREREYTGILVRQDPGALWMWIGSAMLVIGMTVTFACRHRRVWLRVDDQPGQPASVRFASNDRRDFTFERQFTGLLSTAMGNTGDDAPDHPGDQP